MKRLYKEYMQLEKEMDALVKVNSNKLLLNYALAFKAIDDELSDIYRNYADKEGRIQKEKYLQYRRLEKLNTRLYVHLLKTFKDNKQVTRGVLKDIAKESYKQSIEIVNKEKKWQLKPIKKSFDVTKTINQEIAGLNWIERTGRNRTNVLNKLQSSIKHSIEKGETYNTAAARLSKELEVSMNKATTLVRTESHRVLNYSKQQSFEDMNKQGARIKKQWLSSQDERTRSAHSALDGVIVGIDEDFESSLGGVGKSPGNMNNAADDINCRCVQILVIDE